MKSNEKILLEIELRTAQATKELRQFTRDVNIANAKISTAMASVRKNGKPAGYNSKNQFLKEHSLKVAQNKELLAVESDRVKKIIESGKEEIGALKKKVVAKRKSVSDLRRINKAEFGNDFSKQVNAQYKSLDKAIPAMDRYRLATRMVKKQVASAGNAAKKARVPFAGWAMSIMFFGMALKRMFNTVWKSSTSTFNDVMHSVEGTTTQFDLMQGSLKYLGFSVGDALQPIVAGLIPIIDKLSDFVVANPKITAGIIKWIGILGTVFMVGGAGVLAINGFKELGMKVETATGKVNALGSAIGAITVISVAIEVATSDDKQKAFNDGFAKLLVGAGLLDGVTSPIGAAAITVGVILSLVPKSFKDDLIQFLGGVVGIIITSASIVLSTVLSPLIVVFNALMAGYNLIKGRKWDAGMINPLSLAEVSALRTEDLFKSSFNDQAARDRVNTPGQYSPQIFVSVDLDGDQIASNTTTKIVDNINSTGVPQ